MSKNTQKQKQIVAPALTVNELRERLLAQERQNRPYLEIFDLYEKGMAAAARQKSHDLKKQKHQQHTSAEEQEVQIRSKLRSSTVNHQSQSVVESSSSEQKYGKQSSTGGENTQTPEEPVPQYSRQGAYSNEGTTKNSSAAYASTFIVEGEQAVKMEKIEALERRLEGLNAEAEQSAKQVRELRRELQQTQQQLQFTEDTLIATKLESVNLRELIDNKSEQVNQLQSDIKNITAEKINIEKDRDYLMERYLQEKSHFAERLNEINVLEENLQHKQRIFAENEQFQEKKIAQLTRELEEAQMQLRNLGLGHASPPHQKNSLTRSKLTDSGTKHDSAALEQSFVGGKQELPKTVMRRLAKHHSSEIYQIAQTLNGNLVATCGGDRTIRFYDPLNQVTTGVIESQKSDQVFVSVDFAPFANLLAAGSTDKQLSIYDYMTFKLKVSLLGHSGVVDAVSFASDKDKCVSSGTDRTVRVWDINRGVQLKQITPRSSAHTVDCFASEPLFASGHQDGIVRVYSLREERSEPVYQFKEKGEVFEGQITCVTLSNDGNYILASSQQGDQLKLFDLRKQALVANFSHNNYYNTYAHNMCSFGPNEEFVLAGTDQGGIVLWERSNKNKAREVLTNKSGHEGVVIGILYHNLTGFMYSADSRGNFLVWH